MYCVRHKFIAYLQLVFGYRRLEYFVWNPQSGYGFRCTDEDGVRSLLIESPRLERLT
jgi:hypothetical protein